MKNNFLKVAASVLAIAFLAVDFTAYSQSGVTDDDLLGQDDINTITTAVPFLLIGPDARGGALGDAGVASDPDANSIHWNPAKLAFIDNEMGFSLSYTPWLRALVPDINLAYLSGYKRIGEKDLQTVGGSLRYFSLGDITFTDNAGNVIGDFNPSEFAVDVTYARKFSDNISGGMALRFVNSNLTGGINVEGADTKPGRAVAADVSMYYSKPDIRVNDMDTEFRLGVNISNIGNKISYTETSEKDFIPINLRIGPAYKMNLDDYNTIAIMADINKLLVPTPPLYARDSTGSPIPDGDGGYVIEEGKDPNVSVVSGMFGSFNDAPGGFEEEVRELTYSFGLEYWYDNQFAVRAGYFNEHATKGNRKYFTLGAGLRYNVFGLDFAYLIPTQQRNPLENTLRFTLTFDFDAFQKQNENTGE